MKKLMLLALIMISTLSFAGSAFAQTYSTVAKSDGMLYLAVTKANFQGTDLILKSVLSNTGNKTLSNVYKLNLALYDVNKKKFAKTTLSDDNWLTGLKLEPGDTASWTLTIHGVDQTDLSNLYTQYHADFDLDNKVWFDSGIHVVANDKALKSEVAPFIENGTTLVPLRAIFESLGATVSWDQNTQTVTAIKGSDKITLVIGKAELMHNGNIVKLDVAGKIKDGSTMVPLRAISESLGGTVAWGQTGDAFTIAIRQ